MSNKKIFYLSNNLKKSICFLLFICIKIINISITKNILNIYKMSLRFFSFLFKKHILITIVVYYKYIFYIYFLQFTECKLIRNKSTFHEEFHNIFTVVIKAITVKTF